MTFALTARSSGGSTRDGRCDPRADELRRDRRRCGRQSDGVRCGARRRPEVRRAAARRHLAPSRRRSSPTTVRIPGAPRERRPGRRQCRGRGRECGGSRRWTERSWGTWPLVARGRPEISRGLAKPPSVNLFARMRDTVKSAFAGRTSEIARLEELGDFAQRERWRGRGVAWRISRARERHARCSARSLRRSAWCSTAATLRAATRSRGSAPLRRNAEHRRTGRDDVARVDGFLTTVRAALADRAAFPPSVATDLRPAHSALPHPNRRRAVSLRRRRPTSGARVKVNDHGSSRRGRRRCARGTFPSSGDF